MKRKKGFTLLELLAVIVVLGIILTVAIPNIVNIISQARIDACEKQKDLIIDSARKYVLQNGTNITWTNDVATIYLSDLQNSNILSNPLKNPIGGNFNNSSSGVNITVTRTGNNYSYVINNAVCQIDNTKPVITLNGSNSVSVDQGGTYSDAGATAIDNIDGDITSKIVVTNNVNTSTVGTYSIFYNVTDYSGNTATTVTRTVTVIPTGYVESKGVNQPRLATGMTPIKWNGSSWVETNASDSEWFNYSTTAKQWANARTADGSMWVWIPRYAYQIATNYHTSTVGTINIKFLQNNTNTASDGSSVTTTPTYSGSNQTNYILHPAFNFGGTQLTGIWVAKFEATAAEGVTTITGTCDASDDVTTKNIKIIPNATSWRCITLGHMFTVTRNMETSNIYGWGASGTGLDTHLIKNIEWGAVAYLTQSTYGKNSEVWENLANNYTTGCAGNNVSSTPTIGCLRTYDTTNGMNASTTGNIYGIYDMDGGAYEFTAAYVNNGKPELSMFECTAIWGASAKYKDSYPVTTDSDIDNYTNAINIKGDAVYETSSSYAGVNSWYSDSSYMPSYNNVWFYRGGHFNDNQYSGIYAFNGSQCQANVLLGFRPTLVIGTGL